MTTTMIKNLAHDIEVYRKSIDNCNIVTLSHCHTYFGIIVIKGISISSIEIPPCWKVFL